MRTFNRTIETIEFDGGWLCLDFINTVKSRKEESLHNYLVGPEEWLIWTRRQKLLDNDCLEEIKKEIHSNANSSQAFKRIINLREELYLVFKAIANGQKPPKKSQDHFNQCLAFCFEHLALEINGIKKPVETFKLEKDLILLPLLMVIKSAYDLLNTDQLNRVKECDNCGWLYLDTSKNNRRRWCNMQTCGSSIKMKRYYRKIKESD